jgi:hypothetical protein
MPLILDKDTSSMPQEMTNDLKSWMMIALTFVFVLLYVAALTGYLKPLEKPEMLTRLEPIIFVIIGYYFGRLPAQQNEKTLKNEINRQVQKADAAQHSKEKALQEREAFEEKIKNAKSALTVNSVDFSAVTAAGGNKSLNAVDKDRFLYNSIETAVSILDS